MKRLLFLLVPAVAVAADPSISTTRVTQYDYQCQNADKTRISDHQRFDSAFTACANLSLKDGKVRLIQGGSYRITVTLPAPAPPPPPVVVPATGTATATWQAVTLNTANQPVTVTGYRVEYGRGDWSRSVTTTATTANITALESGTWQFRVVALAGSLVSTPSAVVTKVIP
jgi:hypothetical protein